MKKALKICSLLVALIGCFISVSNIKITQVDASAKSPSNIIIVTDSNRSSVLKTKLFSGKETYNPKDRQFAHCASCCQTGNRLWAAWNTGGYDEPNTDMYAVLAYSDDLGETWVDPAIIIDYQGFTDYTPYLFVDDLNRFWVTWNYNGTYAITISNPEATMDKIKYTEMGKILPRSCSSTPIILKDGTYLAAMEGPMPYYYLYASTDKGATWQERSCIQSMANIKYWNEGHVVELSNGDIIYESRIEVGDGYELYTSHDKGYTWDAPEYYRGKPFVSCGVKCGFVKLSNGNFIFATNNSTTKRERMTIYISKDDCKTWSKGLELDPGYCEYPTITEMQDGRVFVVWTRERLKIGEIRGAVLSLDDIENCKLTSNSKNMLTVSRANTDYKDIKKTNLKESYSVAVGKTIDEVIATLPEYVKITADDKGIYPLKIAGYKCENYKDIEGTYRFEVLIDDDTFQDVHDLLHVDVIVKEESTSKDEDNKDSSSSSISSSSSSSSISSSSDSSSDKQIDDDNDVIFGCQGSVGFYMTLPLLLVLIYLVRRKNLWKLLCQK